MGYKAEAVDWDAVLESNGFKRVTTIVTASSKKSVWIRHEDHAVAHILVDKGFPP